MGKIKKRKKIKTSRKFKDFHVTETKIFNHS